MSTQRNTRSKTSKKTKTQQKDQNVSYYIKPADLGMIDWQVKLRKQYGVKQNFQIENEGSHPIFSDFLITSPASERTYKVAIRSAQIGLNFCSCPDFKTNTLGTCKHIEFTLETLRKKRGAKTWFKKGFVHSYTSVFVRYGQTREIMIRIGTTNGQDMAALACNYFDSDSILKQDAYDAFETFLEAAHQIDPEFRCYQDAIDLIGEIKDRHTRQQIIDRYYPTIDDPKLDVLLNATLYPYQKEAVLFAAKAGRSMIADDMGLGKTVQAIGVMALMAKHFGVEQILIVCPTSLKYQWKTEIEKFSDLSVCVIEGSRLKRKAAYLSDPSLIKIASYHVIHHDLDLIAKQSPDLVVLDEAQKIKNWETRTARKIKEIQSAYALALTGTPIENKLEELYSIVSFIDLYKLGPIFQFLDQHAIKDSDGKVVGYRNLHQIRDTLSDIMIRRTKEDVLKQLPDRIDKNYYVSATKEQIKLHNDYYDTVRRLADKWRRHHYLSEKDRHILLLSLNQMRMVCSSTYIIDQKTRHDTKIDALLSFLKTPLENKNKVVIFSQWERMTRLIAHELDQLNIGYEYLHGGIPSKDRKILLDNFRSNSESLVFLSTDAGGTGLNLQSASIVVNMDCPWNPAVLEQRIGRVHRLGQKKSVYVANFVTKGSFEEQLMQETLAFKKAVFSGIFDNGQDEVFVSSSRLKDFMENIDRVTEAKPALVKGITIDDDSFESIESYDHSESKVESETQSPLNDLFQVGIRFLEQLRDATKEESNGKGVSAFIHEDKSTGKKSLNLPLPDDDVIEKAVDLFGSFLSGLKR